MKQHVWVVWAVALLTLAGSVRAQEEGGRRMPEIDLVVNALPAVLLVDVNGNSSDLTDSLVYMMPNISVGAGLALGDAFYADLTAGAGIVVNDGFRSFLLEAVAGATYAASESLTIGPRVGVVYFPSPDWEVDDVGELDDAVGYLVGLQMGMGDRVKYMVSVDYVSVDFDFTTRSDPAVDAFELDALAVQFGVRGEF